MEDERIVDLYWKRSEEAISETSRKYGRYLWQIAYRILNNREDAGECENDTYAAAWSAMPPAYPKNLLAFLGRLARNIALDRYDYNRAKKRNGEFDLLLSELEECLVSPDTVETEMEAGYVAGLISDFLRSLDADSRCMFLRRYWYSDSIRDISRRFGMSDSKVKSNLFRTRKKLKECLNREGVVL